MHLCSVASRAATRGLLLAFWALAAPSIAAGQDAVVIIADDVGYEDLARVATPNLDRLRARGIDFTRAYASPQCSPGRRQLMFGRWWMRESGEVCTEGVTGLEPQVIERSLADLAAGAGANSALFGKWHIGTNPLGQPWELAAQSHGFVNWRAGQATNVNFCGGRNYSRWMRVEDGASFLDLEYEPRAVRDQFLLWWTVQRGRKLAVVSPQLAHGPFHEPPADFLPPGYPPTVTGGDRYEAMIVALDTLVGSVLDVVDLERDLVIFVGDNGTPDGVSPDPGRSKTTTFERGIRVPLIVGGRFREQELDVLVSVIDVHATIAQWFGQPKDPRLDSRSLLDLALTGGRPWILAGDDLDRCARSNSHKLRRDVLTGVEELYDLGTDPEERRNVLGEPEHGKEEALLRAALDSYDETWPRAVTPPLERLQSFSSSSSTSRSSPSSSTSPER
jgi:arylsulfatase A-like enzyme